MSQIYDYPGYIEMEDESLYSEMRSAPLILRVFLFVAIFLLGAVHANNVFASRAGLIVSQLCMVVLALAVLLFGFIGCGWKIKMPSETTLSIAFVLWCLTGFAIARNMEYFRISYTTLAKTVGLYLVIVNLVRCRRDFIWMAFGYVCTVLLMFVMGSEIIAQEAAAGIRAEGIVGDANGLATWATIGFISMLICFTVFENKIIKGLLLLPTPAFLFLVVRSGSRSGMLGAIIVIALVYWWYIRGQVRERSGLVKLGGFLVGGILVAGIIYVVISGQFWYRVQKTFGFGPYSYGTAEGDVRVLMVKGGLIVMSRHPLLGVGYRQYRIVIGEIDPGLATLVSHNTWIEAGCGAGLPGLAMWLAAYVILTRRAWRLRKNPALPLVDRGIVSMCLVFLAFWWFRSLFFTHLGDKTLLPVVAGMTGYLSALGEQYGTTEFIPYTEEAVTDEYYAREM
ncbi:MAG: O-antigen ligase family protein [Desulfobacteraceae bacterium]|nr:O-antigen ligase family protein [Desulfobacteraceae bacterium]